MGRLFGYLGAAYLTSWPRGEMGWGIWVSGTWPEPWDIHDLETMVFVERGRGEGSWTSAKSFIVVLRRVSVEISALMHLLMVRNLFCKRNILVFYTLVRQTLPFR